MQRYYMMSYLLLTAALTPLVTSIHEVLCQMDFGGAVRKLEMQRYSVS